MEGKVELSIERYEELTELERNIGKKLDEIDDLKGKLVKADAVLYKEQVSFFVDRAIYSPFGGSCEKTRIYDKYEYKGHDAAISDVVSDFNKSQKKINELEKKISEKDEEIQRLKNIIVDYEYGDFMDKMRYLFTGTLHKEVK